MCVFKAKSCIGRLVHIRPRTGPRSYILLTDFSIMSNWNIVCNTNIHYVLKYGYDILINNIYSQKSVSLITLCIDAAYVRPVCYRKLIIFVCGSI